VTVSNSVGPGTASLPLAVALPSPGSGPDLSATITGKPGYDSDAFYNFTDIPGIHSCDELPSGACGRSFDIQLPALALQTAGTYLSPGSVVYFETTNQWASTSASVTITVPANGTNLARGLFSALLTPVSGQGGGSITAIGTFRAAQNPVVP
jgi:hypothetical protein